MSRRSGQMQPYRFLDVGVLADGSTAPSLATVGRYVIETNAFDGIELDVSYVSLAGVPGFQLDVFLLDRRTNTFFQDKTQRITETETGNFTYTIQTRGRPVYIRITSLSGTTPTLTLQQAIYTDSRQ